MRSRRVFLVSVAVSALALTCGIAAQVYPSRPITMIVPYPAGGPTDTIARIMAEGMRPSLGQPIVIENVGGASGSIGTGRVARAAGDGYTLGLGLWPTHVINGAVFTLPYDVLNDFQPVSLLVTNPLLIVFQKQTRTRFAFISYRGLGPAMQDLVAGQIDILFDYAANSLPQVRSDTIRAYAVTAPSRLSAAPEIPTVDEAGLPGFYISAWHAFFVPKGTPPTIVGVLNQAAIEALADPIVRRRLNDLGQEIYPRDQQTPEALAAFHKAEIDKWWPLIKAAGIKSE